MEISTKQGYKNSDMEWIYTRKHVERNKQKIGTYCFTSSVRIKFPNLNISMSILNPPK